MKKIIAAALIVSMLGCATPKNIDGKTYGTYGALNSNRADPTVQYEPSFWSILWSVAFFQTLIAPVYFIGFDFMEPVGKKDQ